MGKTKYEGNDFAEGKKPISDQDKRAMAEYYDAGLEVGKISEELLAELSERYGRSTRQIERYIQEYRSKPKSTRHQQDLRSLINRWTTQLEWPAPEDLPDAWSTPGRYRLGSYCWEVLEKIMFEGDEHFPEVRRTQIYCEVEDAPLFKSLKEHLNDDEVWTLYDRFKSETFDYWYARNVMKVRQEKEDLAEQPIDWLGGPYSALKDVFEEATANLTELRVQIISRFRDILDLETIPGSCSRCRVDK